MKTCLLLLIAMAFSAAAVHAAECSLDEIDISTKLKRDPSVPVSCGVIDPAVSTDTSTLASVNPCSAECVAFFEKFVKQLPACDLRGIPLRAPFDTAIAACKGSARLTGGAVVPTSTTTAPSSSGNATSSNDTLTTPTVSTANPVAATPVPSQTSSGVSTAMAATALLVPLATLFSTL